MSVHSLLGYRSQGVRLGILALVAIGPTLSLADDWPMFRKDAGRTAASTDTIKLPLKQTWTYTSKRIEGCAPLSTAVVRGKFIYFTSAPPEGEKVEEKTRSLICVDTTTGKVVWKKPLSSVRASNWSPEDVGPAISESGIIFVTDPTTVYTPCPRPSYKLRAFSTSGTLVDEYNVPIKNLMARLFVRDGDGQHNHLLEPNMKPDG